MKPNIPFNPFHGSEEFKTKDPKEMTLGELELLLHSKRLNLRLDVERLHKHINYSKFLFDILKASGLGEMIEDLISPKENVDSKTSQN